MEILNCIKVVKKQFSSFVEKEEKPINLVLLHTVAKIIIVAHTGSQFQTECSKRY